ncbi:MAG: hypothetical protein ACKE51_08290 [Methylococcaceae bacterium]
MALFDAYKKKSTLNAAIKQTAKARASEGAKAEQLYASVYQGFADVVEGDLIMGEALYNWGFALLHQAMEKEEEQGVKLYLEAISKFTFCLIVAPNHLGAAIDGGVAYMDLARILGVDGNDELYDLAGEFFDNAERIQRGSAAYNLACIYGLRQQPDACLEALQMSKECGSLPSVEAMVNDSDMKTVKNAPWFVGFIEKIVTPEPEVIDESEVTYNPEGDVVNKNKKRKGYENEVDGVVYDAEGNILRGEGADESDNTDADDKIPGSGGTSEKPKNKTT